MLNKTDNSLRVTIADHLWAQKADQIIEGLAKMGKFALIDEKYKDILPDRYKISGKDLIITGRHSIAKDPIDHILYAAFDRVFYL